MFLFDLLSFEAINFHLLHLSLMHEYLNLAFHDIEPTLPFVYNLESVIDNFILLAVFVGNNFLPIYISTRTGWSGCLTCTRRFCLRCLGKFLRVSISSQPTNSYILLTDGYLNESWTINTKRLQVVLDKMGHWEREISEKEYADMNWYKGKQAKHVKEMKMGENGRNLVSIHSPPNRLSLF